MNAHSTTPLSDAIPSKHDVSDENISEAKDEFTRLLGSDAIILSLDERRAHSITKWSPAAPSQIPAFIVFPTSTAEVSAIMKSCSQRRIPVTAYSGGTSMPGALAATRGGICIDFTRMSNILALHEEDMDVVVQPAVGWEDLNNRLASHGLFFPPDPAPGAKIGGMVSFRLSLRVQRC
jgi:D-lactate dehydrogenase (cytochrome)